MGVQPPVYGVAVDHQTRCTHYRQDFDVVAIKHFCCQKYFPCHLCHDELADHPAQVWPTDRFNDDAILCGVCGHELSVTNYLATDAAHDARPSSTRVANCTRDCTLPLALLLSTMPNSSSSDD